MFKKRATTSLSKILNDSLISDNKQTILLGSGDNSQLFICSIFKYEGWLYNVMDDKKIERGSEKFTCPHRDL